MTGIDMSNIYSMELRNSEDEVIASLEYVFQFGKKNRDISVTYGASASETDREFIDRAVSGPLVFTYGGPTAGGRHVESIRMTTYIPGTLSHFIRLRTKFAKARLKVTGSPETEKMYADIGGDANH